MVVTDTVDNTDTSGEAVTTDVFALDDEITKVVSWVAIIENGFNVDTDVTVQFTTADDPEFNKYVTDSDLTDIPVASGDRDGFGDAETEPYSYIRFEIDPASDPSSGSVDITWQRRRLGGD